MEYKVEYIYNGKKDTYYVSISHTANLTSSDILFSIQRELKKFLGYCSSIDSLQILSYTPLYKR